MYNIFKNPMEHLLNTIIIALLICVLGSILVIHKTNVAWQKHSLTYPQITAYLSESITSKEIARLKILINGFGKNTIKGFQYISNQNALKHLQQDSQLKEIVASISDESKNYLPNILIVNTATSSNAILNQLKTKIEKLDLVTSVELDEHYTTKLNHLITFISTISSILLGFFTICLILVIHNLIKLQMLQNSDSISISRLIGASNIFIICPLIYYAIIQLFIGYIIAFGLINWFIAYINKLFISMSTPYSLFTLIPLSSLQLVQTLLILIVLTTLSVFIAVQSILKKYHPQ